MLTNPILTICPEDYPGVKAHLKSYNPTGLVEYTSEITANIVKDRKLVIVGGWHPIYYEALQKIAGTGVPRALLWTSSVGQIDFANNGVEISYLYLIKDLVNAGLINYVFTPTIQIQNMFQHLVDPKKVILLPHGFDWEDSQKYLQEDIEVQENAIDLFCTGETRKNFLPQVHAATITESHLYINNKNPRYIYYCDLMGLKYSNTGWMLKEGYYKTIQRMKLGTQITYAESFDYVVAEHFAMKKPCLISTVMGRWVDKKLWKSLLVQNPDDPLEMADMIMSIRNMPKDDYKELGESCHKFMKKESEKRTILAKSVLGKIIEE